MNVWKQWELYSKDLCKCGLCISKQQRNLLLTAGAKTTNLLCTSFWGNSAYKELEAEREAGPDNWITYYTRRHTQTDTHTHWQTHTVSKLSNFLFDSLTCTYTQKQSTVTQTLTLTFPLNLWYNFLTHKLYACLPLSPSLSLSSIFPNTHTHAHAPAQMVMLCALAQQMHKSINHETRLKQRI